MTTLRILCLMALFLAAAMPTTAQEVPLTLDHMDVTAYSSLNLVEFTSKHGYGLVETVQEDGMVYLRVDVYFAPPWTEEIDRVEVDKEDIMLVDKNGNTIHQMGYFDYYSQFELSANWFNESRPWDWQEEPEPFHYNAVFSVPRDIGPLELKIGSFSAPIDGTVTVKEFPNALDTATIVVKNAYFVDRIVRHESVGDLEIQSTIVDTVGKILAVELEITPLMGNGDNPEHFFWLTSWIGIACDNGYRGPALGEEFSDSLSDYVSHNLSRSSDGTWSSGEALFYFAVPADTTSFKLTYLGRIAAEGAVAP